VWQTVTRPASFTRRELVECAAAGAVAIGLAQRSPTWAAAAVTPARDPAIIGSWGGLQIPAVGAYFCADDTTRGFTTPTGIETQLRRRMGFRNRRYGWLAKCPSAAAIADSKLSAPGVVPMTSFGSPSMFPVKSAGWSGHGDLSTTSYGQGIDRITNGEFDSYWRSVALGLKALGVPVIFRLWQEPNGPHNPYYGAWQGGLGTGGEAAFGAAWRHVWTVFNAEKATLAAGGNCIWVFCAQQTTGPAKTGGPWQPYWPGGDVVDWSGMDLYRETFPFEAVNPPVYGSFYQWAVDNQKPFMICESGFQQGKVVTDSSGRYDKDGSVTGNSLITATRTAVKQYPQCVAYGIWNNGRGNLADFVDTSAASLAQYRAFAHDPWFTLTRS
jgi:hypothetical protein